MRKKKDELRVRYYTPDLKGPVKFAVVSDLHERPFGEILRKLKGIQPDVILLPGDTLERRPGGIYEGYTEEELARWMGDLRAWHLFGKILRAFGLEKKNDQYEASGNGLAFIRAAVDIAPVVMSVGNHEWKFTEEDMRVLRECGVHFLDNADETLMINGQPYLFGGLSTRYDRKWLKKFAKKSGDKILLCHHPEYYDRLIRNRKVDTFSLVIAGHAHGGQCRIFGHGLLAPGQGFFPKYTRGMYGHLLVSAGAANTAFLPRWGNPREILVVEASGQKED